MKGTAAQLKADLLIALNVLIVASFAAYRLENAPRKKSGLTGKVRAQ